MIRGGDDRKRLYADAWFSREENMFLLFFSTAQISRLLPGNPRIVRYRKPLLCIPRARSFPRCTSTHFSLRTLFFPFLSWRVRLIDRFLRLPLCCRPWQQCPLSFSRSAIAEGTSAAAETWLVSKRGPPRPCSWLAELVVSLIRVAELGVSYQ